MKEVLINQITQVIIAAMVGVLVIIIKNVGDKVVELMLKKKEEIEQNIEASGHAELITTAKEIWGQVDEKFRITANAEKLFTSKADEFNKMLLEKVPGITSDQIEYLRQTIAGEVNAGKAALTKEDVDISTLQKENIELKQKLNTILSTATTEATIK